MTGEIVFPSVLQNLPEPVRQPEKGRVASSEPANGRLAEACTEFESFFIYHLIKQMRATIPKSDLLGERRSEEMVTSIMDLQLAGKLAEKGGIGISAMLSRQLLAPPKDLPDFADNKVVPRLSALKDTVTGEKAVRE